MSRNLKVCIIHQRGEGEGDEVGVLWGWKIERKKCLMELSGVFKWPVQSGFHSTLGLTQSASTWPSNASVRLRPATPPPPSRGCDTWAAKCPAVGTKKEGKHPILNPLCSSFHLSDSQKVPLQAFWTWNVSFQLTPGFIKPWQNHSWFLFNHWRLSYCK